MSYYTLDQIKRDGTVDFRRKNLERFSKSYKTTIFLSHSHHDNDIVGSVISFLLNNGIYIYVDWLDPTMPQTTSGETASKIKDKINQCERFIVLLTENSKESKWVPWELGYADAQKDNDKISILPVKRNYYTRDSEFEGIEYMQLYRQIVFGHIIATKEPTPTILNVRSSTGTTLSGWLS